MSVGVSIVIDPSGAQTGGRVVRRELQEIGEAAVNAQRMTDQLGKAQKEMAKSAQSSAQALFQQQDALRAKYNPTFAVIQRYKAAQTEIRDAHRLGALSVNEMATALSRERQATLSAIDAIKSYSTAVKSIPKAPATIGASAKVGASHFETANIAAQFQDIAVTSAMGMSPLQIALQQGTQLSSVLGPMGATGAVKGLAIAFTSLLNPVSLVTMGLVAGTAALIQYFTSAEDGTKRVDTLLKQHAENIEALKDAYGIAAEGLKQMAVDGRSTIAANAKETLENTLSVVADAAKDTLHEALSLPASDFAGNVDVFDQFAKAINDLREGVKAGKPDLLAYQDALSAIAVSGNAWDSQKALANNLRMIDEEAIKAAKSLPAMMETAAVSAGKAASNVENLYQRLKKLADQNGADISQGIRPINTTADLIKDITGRDSDLFRSSAFNRAEELLLYKRASRGLRELQTELDKTKSLLNDAAKTAPSDIFGIGASAEKTSGVLEASVGSIRKVYEALSAGTTGAKAANDSIEKIRQSLYALGGDHQPIDVFVDSIVNGSLRVQDLEASIASLSQAILNIPNKTISIGIQQYTVPSSGGGTKNVNVLGGGVPDMTMQQYNVNGKNHTVYGGNGTPQSPSFPGMVYLNRGQLLAMSPQEFNTRVGVYSGETYWDYQAVWGYRAEGGPVSAGGTYLVGEKGPELLKMQGGGQVTNANSTAALLSGGRDTLSLIEDHLYNAVQELRIHTNYFETYESDFTEMVACLKSVESGIKSAASAARSTAGSSYGSSGSGGASKSGGYGRSSANSNSAIVDYNSPYMGPGITFTNGTGAIGYATYNITPSVLGTQHNPGFALGGQILPGEDQKVEFFKRNKERVLIVDDSKVSDQRSAGGSSGSGKSERPINLRVNFNGGNLGDARSRQAMADEFRRAVQQVTRS
ncbi:phage tail length tape measure family protein [Rhizobium fabae]|uniref:Bacteriophage tail tape measure N-terminal domain-containing protein n=1 Tax=Rhizobium fabae TaxID=573179 RepID=A0A7W6FHX9_9HYPH|nr:phage tail length tape measure family protein [Rhizobium fabae]MBB3913881.1 hypothetical protein [Rhizobium fabae]RUM16303.1 hypothetical protein EFB14_02990 [Rhizobium fabae]